MIRVCETKDRFEVRAERLNALLRNAGVSEQGPRTARPTFFPAKSRRIACNIVIEWLCAKPTPLSEYLAYLVRFDHCLRHTLGSVYRAGDTTLRLALALFLDFAHAQGLNAVELAALMQDAQRELLEAAEFLLAQNDDLPGENPGSVEDRPEAWGDSPALAT